MELTLDTVLMVLAVICLVLAALGVAVPRVQVGWLGLALWAVTALTP